MKQLLKLFLFMGVLCMAGCSGEDPQHVAFSVNELEVGPDATRMTIGIEANCPWTITDEKNKTFTEEREGIGSMETIFIVLTNPDFEPKQYTVTITSEDGTSSDVLIVHQKEQYGLEADRSELIAAEGGEVHIPVRTNDKIDNIETPDWITFTSSRALTGYTYTFAAEPNKTGSPRKGKISLYGEHYTSSRIDVTQDSYAPTGVDTSLIPEVIAVDITDGSTFDSLYQYPIALVPDYADFSKLRMDYDPRTQSNASIGDYTLNIKFFDKGYKSSRIGEIINLSFYNNKELIAQKEVRPLFEYLTKIEERTVLVGKTTTINTGELPKEYYQIELPDDGAVTHAGDFVLRINKLGTHSVILKSLLTGKEKNIKINALEYIASAYATCKQDIIPSIWTVSLHGSIEGSSISQCVSAFIDKSAPVQAPHGKKEDGINSPVNYVLNHYSFELIAYTKEELEKQLSDIKFIFEATINGEKISEEIPIEIKW